MDISALEEKIKKIEFIFESGPKDIVREVQQGILQDLYELKTTLVADLEEMKRNSESNVSDAKLLEEIHLLKEENSRLKYRVEHLKRHIN